MDTHAKDDGSAPDREENLEVTAQEANASEENKENGEGETEVSAEPVGETVSASNANSNANNVERKRAEERLAGQQWLILVGLAALVGGILLGWFATQSDSSSSKPKVVPSDSSLVCVYGSAYLLVPHTTPSMPSFKYDAPMPYPPATTNMMPAPVPQYETHDGKVYDVVPWAEKNGVCSPGSGYVTPLPEPYPLPAEPPLGGRGYGLDDSPVTPGLPEEGFSGGGDNSSGSTGSRPSGGKNDSPSFDGGGFMDTAAAEKFAESVVGMSEVDAQTAATEEGLTLRVTSRDGEDFPVTMDYRTDRVNVKIVDGEVVEANVG